MNPDDPVESAIIAAVNKGAGATGELLLGIGDDAAIFRGGRVVTLDTMVEGVHWDDRLSPADVGFKLVAVNVSDIAAMGGRPTHALLSISVPPDDLPWVRGFAEGLTEALSRWNVQLVGGDTTRSPVRAVSLTLEGHAAKPLRRDGAKAGDRLYVAGPLGLAAEAMCAASPGADALAWLRRPLPRPDFAAAVAPLVHAAMDLSDGLRTDLRRLCLASRLGARVDSARVPGRGPIGWRAAYGDDYALLLAAPADAADALCSLASMFALPLADIGELCSDPAIRLDDDESWPEPGFSHFPRGVS